MIFSFIWHNHFSKSAHLSAGAIRSEPANRRADFMLNKETIKKLQIIVEEEYERKITFEETEKIANNLVGYFDLLGKLYHEIKSENSENN